MFYYRKKHPEIGQLHACSVAYKTLQAAITSNSTFVHYSSTFPLALECDTPMHLALELVQIYVISCHVEVKGLLRLYLNHYLHQENNIRILKRSDLLWHMPSKKCHRFLCGRRVTLVYDHKQLLMVFEPKGHIISVLASRLLWWSLILSAYNFTLEFRSTEQHANADYFS